MKKWIAMLIVALVVPNLYAANILVGGTYYDGHGGSLYDNGYSGDVQLRIPVANNLDLGVSAGYGLYSLDTFKSESGRRWRKSTYVQNGTVEAIQLGISGIYGIPVGPARLEAEVGAQYNIIDADVRGVVKSRCRFSSQDIELYNFWIGKAGLNLAIPIGMPSIVAGCGYQFTLSRTELGSRQNNIDGLYAKLGVMFPL